MKFTFRSSIFSGQNCFIFILTNAKSFFTDEACVWFMGVHNQPWKLVDMGKSSVKNADLGFYSSTLPIDNKYTLYGITGSCYTT